MLKRSMVPFTKTVTLAVCVKEILAIALALADMANNRYSTHFLASVMR